MGLGQLPGIRVVAVAQDAQDPLECTAYMVELVHSLQWIYLYVFLLPLYCVVSVRKSTNVMGNPRGSIFKRGLKASLMENARGSIFKIRLKH